MVNSFTGYEHWASTIANSYLFIIWLKALKTMLNEFMIYLFTLLTIYHQLFIYPIKNLFSTLLYKRKTKQKIDPIFLLVV